MEKDIGSIQKSMDTDIVVRIDDFGGRVGLTIREFVRSERYSGFTKAGTRIPADKFKQFKDMINAIDENELQKMASQAAASAPAAPAGGQQRTFPGNSASKPAAEKKPTKKAAPVADIEEQEF
jgi:ribosomal protein L12E/L44/L45/RPP1/RPP2